MIFNLMYQHGRLFELGGGAIVMTSKIFKAVPNADGSDWLICWTGTESDGKNWSVTTNRVHASELHQYSAGAEGDAVLIARLLNWYHSNKEAAESALIGDLSQ